MAELTVAGKTSVIITSGLPDDLLPRRPGRQKVLLITQDGPGATARAIAEQLSATGLECVVKTVPDRDDAKTLEVAEALYTDLAQLGVSRDDSIVAVGGGSVTDLAGFVAGTWLRGIEVVHFPTTLLAAVDASIGGKTGVNLAGKNLVGVIWHPSRVVIDTALLAGLPAGLLREGMAEALKTGLVGDEVLFDLIRRDGLDSSLAEVIERSVMVKGRIVGGDEREHGERAFLNFGHTGHIQACK